ncbi:MAG: 50S ribosomal protein L29 [Prevotellaceae bacterium]|jgi:large subunit ribosomal protein L29|nr:50S ribosomal protein L29 [Prevotellaceae bacterium]
MKPSEIREMSTKDLLERVEQEKNQQTKMRLNHAISPLENTSKIKAQRKDIARMLTILHERKINEIKK